MSRQQLIWFGRACPIKQEERKKSGKSVRWRAFTLLRFDAVLDVATLEAAACRREPLLRVLDVERPATGDPDSCAAIVAAGTWRDAAIRCRPISWR
jgi:hypothetical protein